MKILILCFFCACLASCGGSDSKSSDHAEVTVSQSETSIGSGATPSSHSPSTSGDQCHLSRPVCTLITNPTTTAANRVLSGTSVFLQASCNTTLNNYSWQDQTGIIAQALSVTIRPTVDSGSLDAKYKFNYSNCAGSDYKDLTIFVTNRGGGNTGEGATDKVTYTEKKIGWLVHQDGGDIYRISINNTGTVSLNCQVHFLAEYFYQVSQNWVSDSVIIGKTIAVAGNALVDLHWNPQSVRGITMGTKFRNPSWDINCKKL